MKFAAVLTLAAATVTFTHTSTFATDAVSAGDRPKVEFVEVEGQRCLQPVINAAPVERADYRAAELRWLASKRPGAPAPRWETITVLSPRPPADDEPHSSTVGRETAYLDGVVGPGATVCFDINHLQSKSSRASRAPSDAPVESPYYALIGIGWAEKADDGPRFVWHPDFPGIDPGESMRIFKYLASPDIEKCLASIIDSNPAVRADLATMGAGTVCGGAPEAVGKARALWTSYGFAEALSEVARSGRPGEAVTTFFARCSALENPREKSDESSKR